MLRRITLVCLPLLVVVGVIALVALAARIPTTDPPGPVAISAAQEIDPTVAAVNQLFADRWIAAGVQPAEPAEELQILRRLSLVLHGTIPSLEEIRLFETDAAPRRLERWTARMLTDRRFADYFAERLARGFVGHDEGQFIVFRRDRFVNWLSDRLHEGRSYDVIVRQMVAERGLWTGKPGANFITAAMANGELDENKLAGRTVRAFLGQRIDCAQCHDHFFSHWKQAEFAGLASFFGQTKLSVVGVEDSEKLAFEVEDRQTLAKTIVEPSVPFHPEWLPDNGTRRERLAAWVTHPENRRFERAIANRTWGLMFGRPYFSPVDDLPDPENEEAVETTRLLDILGADLRTHGFDLRRLMAVIAASRPFRLASTHPQLDSLGGAATVEETWAAFPLTRLRPEQVIGALLQASSARTIDQNSHLFVRAIRFFREKDFVKQYGDLGENELDAHSGTIPQALLRMNGTLVRETIEAGGLSASGRIADMAANDANGVETSFLVCLTRRPTTEERAYFEALLEGTQKQKRHEAVEDLFWTLFNSPEFSWNH